MPKSLELIATETREIRLQLKTLIDSGLSKSQAMLKLFPNDSNRSRKLRFWEKHELFPVPEAELLASSEQTVAPEPTTTVAPEIAETVLPEPSDDIDQDDIVLQETETTSAYIADSPQPEPFLEASETVAPVATEAPDTVLPFLAPRSEEADPENLLRLIDEKVAEKVENHLVGMVAGLHVSDKRPAGAGRGHVGRNYVKLHISIPTDLHAGILALGGVMSQHIAHAIRIYLTLRAKGNTSATKTVAPQDPAE